MPRDTGPPVNEKCLRYADVRLIGADGSQVGIVQTRKALQMAKDAGLDLVAVATNAQPPVCRIIDYGKYKYEQGKKERESKAKRFKQDVKGIKLRPNTAGHDLQVLLRNALKFLAEGHKVRFLVQFRAREVTHPEIGAQKLEWFLGEIGQDKVLVEKTPSMEGRQMTMVVSPTKKLVNKDGKVEKNENVKNSGQEVQNLGNGQDPQAQSL
jgi:translation initiation factor IF-3